MHADCYSEIPDAKIVAVAAYKSAEKNAPVKISDISPNQAAGKLYIGRRYANKKMVGGRRGIS